MTNSTIKDSQRVRFEEATPTHEIVAYFSTQLPTLVGGTGLPIFPGYDDLDDIQFAYITLPSGNTVVLGQYENAPQIGVDLYVDLARTNNSTALAINIPALVIETLRYLAIPRETAIWFHPDYEEEINRLYSENVEIEPIARLSLESLPQNKESEPIDCFYYALNIYTRDKLPEYWAQLQHNLGLAYYHRQQGEKWKNLQISIECFNKSLEVFKKDEYPQKWQINQEDLHQSQAAWDIEKPKLISSLCYRPDKFRNLSGADLSRTYLVGANLSGVNLSHANLSGAYLSRAKLHGIDLIDSIMSSAELIGTELIGANLSGAELSNANLSFANLTDANLSNANLSDINLSCAELVRSNLSGTNLSNANLSFANLSDADLRDANVSNTQFGVNKGISELRRRDLILRGAIFIDNPGDRVESPIPVRR